MAIITTHSIVARSPRLYDLSNARMVGPHMPDGFAAPPTPGTIEIVRETRVEVQRTDGTRMPGTSTERTSEALLTMTVEEAEVLIRTLVGAIIDAIDTRPVG